MLTETEHRFRTWDGLNLFYRYFESPNPVAQMIIIHGHGEHSGRYGKFAQALKDENVSLAVLDSRGNGHSEGKEVYINHFSDYVRDIDAFVLHLDSAGRTQGQRIILFGHSLGGLSSLYWSFKNKERLKGLILSSPCLGLNLPLPAVILNKILNKVFPGFIYGSPIYPPHLSHDPDEIEKYKKDPLIKRKISVRLLDQMLTYSSRLSRVSEFKYECPVIILMAELEKVVDPAQTYEFFDRLKAPGKKIVSFEGFYHEIFNEAGQEKAFEALKQSLRDILNN